MYVQPLMLTAMAGRPPIGAAFEVQGVRGRLGGCTGCQGESPEGTEQDSSWINARDEVSISQEAEAALDGQLSESQQRVVQDLKNRDREVRTHEQAHLAAAGPYATGGPSLEYQAGPDGRRYAVGGEVSIDVSPIPGDPEATLRKAQVIRAAALAPANPSAQDRSVAAAAAKMEVQAQQELRQQEIEQNGATQNPFAQSLQIGDKTPTIAKAELEGELADVTVEPEDELANHVGIHFDAVA